jgi:hypothetical protein
MRERLEELAPEWEAALADADFDAKQVRFYPFPGDRSEDGFQAYYFVPGQKLYRSQQFPDDLGGQIADANKHLNRHRIAAWIDTDLPVLGAKLRHELEHARQHDAFGDKLYDLNDLIAQVFAHKLRGLKGGARLYNFNPIELDANAAAARFAWERYGEQEAKQRLEGVGEDAVLFRSLTGPAPIETLPKRLLCFLAQFPDLCEMEAEARDKPFDELLDKAWPGFGESWNALAELGVE